MNESSKETNLQPRRSDRSDTVEETSTPIHESETIIIIQ